MLIMMRTNWLHSGYSDIFGQAKRPASIYPHSQAWKANREPAWLPASVRMRAPLPPDRRLGFGHEHLEITRVRPG